MNFKIIQTSGTYPDVLLTRDREDNETVKIIAFGKIREDEDQMVETVIDFPEAEYAKAFINCFSIELAEVFCETHEIKY